MKEKKQKNLVDHLVSLGQELHENEIKAVVCPQHYVSGISTFVPQVATIKCHRGKVLASDWQIILAEAKTIHRNLGLKKCVLNKDTGDIVTGSMLSIRRNGESICCIMTKVPIDKEVLFKVSNKLFIETGFSTTHVLPTHTNTHQGL